MMDNSRQLYYLSDADVPGNNARSIQEMRMCQAFSAIGLDVTHLHTQRIGEGTRPTWEEVAEYYGLTEEFDLCTFRTLQNRVRPFPKIETLSMAGPMTLYVYLNVLLSKLEQSDIIYSRNYYPTYFLSEIKNALPHRNFPPIVFEHHDTMQERYQQRFFEMVDAVVCITHVLERHTIDTFDVSSERIFVAPDGVDLSRYDAWSQTEARTELGLPVGEPIVVYTGHLYPGKGAEVLARAAKNIDAQVRIVGGYPEDIQRVRSEVEDVPNLEFEGFVDPGDIPPYQVAADVLVAPYTHEARRFVSPLKLFEYMAAGRPIVATDIPVLHEVLTHERNALLADPGDEKSLALEVNRFLSDNDLSTQLSATASEDVTNYTWEQRAADILEDIHHLQSGR